MTSRGYYCKATGHRWGGWRGKRGERRTRACTRGSCHAQQVMTYESKTGTVGKDIEREVVA